MTSTEHNEPILSFDRDERREILLLEDEMRVALVLSRMLNTLGFQVKIAKDALQARTIIERQYPHFCLIIADYGMRGGEDGLSFLSWAKVQYPQTHRVLISGLPLSELRETIDKTCDAFLTKPFDGDKLKEVLFKQLSLTSALHRAPYP
jgi:CheY-like chemotaxis protein